MHVGTKIYSGDEEKILFLIFGRDRDESCQRVLLSWL